MHKVKVALLLLALPCPLAAQNSRSDSAKRAARELGGELRRYAPRGRLTLAAAGWTLACLAFLALGILTPVDMRYYLASIPAIAIAGAAGLRFLWERGTGGRVAAGALAALALADGARTWWQTF